MRRRRFRAKSGVEDFAALAVRREREERQGQVAARVGLSDKRVEKAAIQGKCRAVLVCQRDRGPGERDDAVLVQCMDARDDTPASEACKRGVEVVQRGVIDLDVETPAVEHTHNSSLPVAGRASTVGELSTAPLAAAPGGPSAEVLPDETTKRPPGSRA